VIDIEIHQLFDDKNVLRIERDRLFEILAGFVGFLFADFCKSKVEIRCGSVVPDCDLAMEKVGGFFEPAYSSIRFGQ
jgi:hypothetical protein